MEHIYLRVRHIKDGKVIRKYLNKQPSNLSDDDIAAAKFRVSNDLAVQGYIPSVILDILAVYRIWFRQAPKTYKKIFISETGNVIAEIRRG